MNFQPSRSVNLVSAILLLFLLAGLAADQNLQNAQAAVLSAAGKVCNQSPVEILLVVKTASGAREMPLAPGKCSGGELNVQAVLGKQCRAGGMSCEARAWMVKDGVVEVIEGYVSPQNPSRVLYIVEKRGSGGWGSPGQAGLSGTASKPAYGLATAAMTQETLDRLRKMHDKDVDVVMQILATLPDGSACMEDVAMVFFTGITPPNAAVDCSGLVNALNDVLEAYNREIVIGITQAPGGPVALQVQHSGKCLDLTGVGGGEYSTITVQSKCTGSSWQRWVLEPVDGTYYRIKHAKSGECVDVAGGSKNDGAPAILWACHDGGNQRWRLEPGGPGFLLKNYNSGKCLDVTGGSKDDSVGVIQYTCTGNANQIWVTR